MGIFPSIVEITFPFSVLPLLERNIWQSHMLNGLFHINSFQNFRGRWIKLFGIQRVMNSKDVYLSRELSWISMYQKAVTEQSHSYLAKYLE